jgi:ADP-ribosylglycohydrolase
MADWYVGGFMAPTVDNLEAIEADIATSQSIKRFTNAIPSDRTGSSDENAVECGALGRALPLGLFYATDSIDTLVDETCRFSRTTHNSLDSEVCCTLLAMIARNLFLQKAEKVFDLLEDYFKVKKKKDYVAKVQEVKAAKDKPGSNSLAIHCFWNAWESYSAKQRSYEGAVRYSIRHGGDTSTVASITGGLAGLTKGVNDIPRKWVRQMKLHPDVVEQAGIFVDLALARMTGQL